MILNVSSGIASIPFPMYTLYAASKASFTSAAHSAQATYDPSHFNLRSYRCLWKDFLKVYKLNTKIRGLLSRYFDPHSDIISSFMKRKQLFSLN